MASLSAYFSYDANTMDRGIPYAQFTAFQYNTGSSIWYNRSVRPTGTLFVAGRNNVGQLGLGNNVDTNTFIQLTGQWDDVACGSTCMFAKSAGTNRWFGTGYNRSLGAGFNAINYNTLTPLTGEWRTIVPSGKFSTFTMAISAGTNTLFGTGDNTYGQLGLGNNTTAYTFTALTGNWSNVFVGGNHTMALSAGTTKLFGTGQCDPYGQLGLGTTFGNYKTFTQVAGDWSDVACGVDFTAALSAGTNFWYGCGDSSDYPLGGGTGSTFTALTIAGIGAPKFSKMFCGYYNSFGLSAGTTKLYGSGFNAFGTLGTGDNTMQYGFTQIPGNWLDVYCGYSMTLALSAKNNKLFVTGSNTYGQFGIGNNIRSYSFIDTNSYITKAGGGDYFTAILQANNITSPMVVDNFENQPITFKMRPISDSGVTGTEASFSYNPPPVLYGTGRNDLGQLGLGNTTNRNTFTALSGNWRQISYGNAHTMALSAGTNALFATGYNFYGNLGLGNSGAGTNRNTFTQLTGNWSQVACCDSGTMALSAGTTRLFGTGENFFGELGLGDTVQRTTLTQLTGNWSQVICGGGHTVALSAGTAQWFGTGNNSLGQLGLGNSTYNTFTALIGNWSQVVCGQNYTMALSADTIKWFGTGSNSVGQCGLGNFNNASTFTQLTGDWSQIVCGYNHTMALSAGTTKLFGTGWNLFGELGLGDTGTSTKRNTFTALTGNWSQVTCGPNLTMAKSADTNAWFGTGYNFYGQLGLGDETDRTTLTPLTGNLNMVNKRSSSCIMASGY